jgi:4-carboxymuconolactone decarboxylase
MASQRIPSAHQRMRSQHADYMQAVDALGAAVRAAGPLKEPVLQLVQLAAAAAIRSEGAVHSHVRRALQAGVTAAQIRHALLSVTSTIGFPTVRASLAWADDVIGAARPRLRRSRAAKTT